MTFLERENELIKKLLNLYQKDKNGINKSVNLEDAYRILTQKGDVVLEELPCPESVKKMNLVWDRDLAALQISFLDQEGNKDSKLFNIGEKRLQALCDLGISFENLVEEEI